MIRDLLIPEVEKHFGHLNLSVDWTANPIVRIRPIQPIVGCLLIHDDGNEATVYIENISHGHFGTFDFDQSVEGREMDIAESVIGFIHDLFADRVLLFTSPDNRIGGWRLLDENFEPPLLLDGYRYYLWSRPYEEAG